ncbi:MAG: TonB-dependent receptor plug domain-containing protein [Sulfuricurvum sp.]|uniref:TonB-dependent receptor plug domain-containing protein n=1 Tax=Sulfuricurvum sp. TaxID=2025608 RepID=UPI002639BA30|nr:TonB-dependent receptor plug domain-containing protein [Sulfuricurvum sp.]MDD5117917.1 TonB-dependent receptor plug domain-containing protein [Sulfuricurvum sp.]
MKMTKNSITKTVAISFVAALVLSPLSALAAADATSSSLDPVNVTASTILEHDYLDPKSPTNPYRVESTAEAGTEIYTEKDIQNLAPRDVLDLIDRSVGFDVTYQGRKNPYFVNDRGGGSFTYIIDGAILPKITDRILLKIPITAIEQIQIVRGSTSLPLGPSINIAGSNSGAGLNTGFIIIRTKQPKKTMLTLNAGAEKAVGGQPTATKSSFYTGLVLGDSSINGYIGGMKSGMRRPSLDTWFDGQQANSTMINAGLNIGRFSIKLMGYNDTGRFEMQRGVKTNGTLDISEWYYDPTTTHLFSADASMVWNEHHTTLINYFTTKYSQSEYDSKFATATTTAVLDTTASNYYEETSGHSIRHNIQYGDTKIMLGMQSASDIVLGSNGQSSNSSSDTKVTGYGVSVEQGLFDNALTIDAGYRQDTKHLYKTSLTYLPDYDMPPSTVFAMGTKWDITPKYSLNARYYKGSQGTQGDFDVKADPSIYGTASLDPESQTRIEATFEAKLLKEFRPALTWFNVKINNTKSQTSNTYLLDGNTYYYYTQADSKRDGLELLVKGKFDFGTNYKIGLTHMLHNSSTSYDGTTTDSVGISTPEDLYIVSIGQEWENYRANISANHKTGWSSSTASPGTTTGLDLGNYTRIDANIIYKAPFNNPNATIKLYGRNLTNDQYATRYTTGYYYDRGRTFGAELTMEF